MERQPGAVEGMAINPDFWRGKSVFLTGHTGFKGGWLALWLKRMGARVTGYALPPPTTPSLFGTAGIADALARSTIADIRDPERLNAALAEAQAEIVFHLAAQPLVRAAYEDPIGTYAVNVMGTVHLLEAIRRCPTVRAAVMVTSDKCYENREWWWGYRENEPMGGHDPYSSSKGCAELVSAAYRRSFFADGRVALASARAGNVIGGGDWAADRLLPDLVRAFGQGQPLTLRNPGAVRPWQHVLEPLAGYLLLAERLLGAGAGEEEGDGESYAGGWNFGPRDEDARSVLEVVSAAARLWGEGALWQVQENAAAEPHEARTLKLDCSLARGRLGWAPRLGLDAALAWTLDWYRAQRAGEDMRACCAAQIDRYQGLKS